MNADYNLTRTGSRIVDLLQLHRLRRTELV
jgi:hypothetical protein